MPKSHDISALYVFGDFVLEAGEQRLRRGEETVSLTPKTFDLLLHFVENEGRLLRKGDLLNSVWPDAAVEENNLTVAISTLRKALGEEKETRFIQTVPKVGYRFVASVRKVSPCDTFTSAPVVQDTDVTLLAPEHAGSAERPPRVDMVAAASAVKAADEVHRPWNMRWWLIIGSAALILVLCAVFAIRLTSKQHAPATPRRLAILPFRNLRGNAEDQFLAVSLADAIITRLASLRELTVRPSYDIQKYTDVVDLTKLAADLAVDAVLTGTFIHEGNELRITGQLVDVKTHDTLWNGGFDVKYNKLLTVQEKVAQQIIEGLRVTMSPAEAASLKVAQAIDPIAYEYYLRGVDLYAQNEFELAGKVLEKSIELAPYYAPSWANLGRAYTASASFQFGGDELYRKAEAAFAHALALEPKAIESRVYMANMFTDTGRVEKAVPLLRQALAANPAHAESHWELGYAYRFAGMLQESAAECERARHIDPAVKLNSSALNSYLYLGQYDRFLDTLSKSDDVALIVFYRGLGEYYRKNNEAAIADFDRAFELDRSIPQSREGKALSLILQHRENEAKTMLRSLEKRILSGGSYDPEAVYKLAQVYVAAGDAVSALRALKYSIDNGFFPYAYLQSDPLLDPVRDEPQFHNLMEAARTRHEAFRRAFF